MASSTPTFQEIVIEAKTWLEKDSSPFSWNRVEEDTRNIFITASDNSLYITPPENAGEQWTVWSDSSNTAHTLSSHLDYLTNQNRNISEILSKLQVIFNSEVSNSESDDEDEDEVDEEEEEEDDFYEYYGGDEDVENEEVKQKEKYDDTGVSADDFFTGDGSPAAVHRLLADLKNMNKSNGKFGITGTPRGDNLFIWDIELSDFDKTTLLYKDLKQYAETYRRKPVVELEMKFPKDYPMNPPFVRVTRPRFQFLTGHVTIGGSVCMQMLTRSGWSPSNDIESILVQVRAEIMSDKNARLDGSPNREYSESEARSAFERMVHRYGWNR